jgi:cysteine desulfurase
MQRIYMDYNATTPLAPEVKESFVKALDMYANGSSLYEDGRRGNKLIEIARQKVATLIGSHSSNEVIFTSGGSESDNTVFNTMLSESKKRGRTLIVITAIEHPAIMRSATFLKEAGLDIIYLPVDGEGFVDMTAFDSAMQQKPLLVAIMTANNEVGTIMDIGKLCKKAHQAGALFHTDAVQAVGKIPFNAKELAIDYAAFSAHKIYGPKGMGALYVKNGAPIVPLIRGGEQEHNLRAGTYNVPGIVAFGKAAEIALSDIKLYDTQVRNLRNRLRDGLWHSIPNIKLNGPIQVGTDDKRALPNTLDVSFPGAEGESILLHLDLLGVDVSTGSACASASLDGSPVLAALGLGPELAHSSIRFSLGKFTTQQEVDYVIEKLPPVIDKLRKMSTIG